MFESRKCLIIVICVLANAVVLARGGAQQVVDRQDEASERENSFPTSANAASEWIERPDVQPKFERVAELRGSGRSVIAVGLSLDSEHVIGTDADGDCRIWSVAAGKETGRFQDNLPGKPRSVALGLNGKRGVIGCDRRGIVWWDTDTGKIVGKYDGPQTPVMQLAVLPKRNRTVGYDQSRVVHRVESDSSGEEIGIDKTTDLVAFTSSGEFILVADSATRIVYFLYYKGAISEKAQLKAMDAVGTALAAIAANDDVFAFIGQKDNQDWLFINSHPDKNGNSKWAGGPCQVRGISRLFIDPDSNWVTGINALGQVEIWRPKWTTFSRQGKIDLNGSTCLAAGIDGRTIAVGHANGAIHIWRLMPRPDSGRWRMTYLVAHCFEREDYALLESLGTLLADDSQPYYWHPFGSKLEELIRECESGPDLPANIDRQRERIRTWREKRPESVLAKLVEVRSLISAAWKARGEGTADQVTPEGWKGLYENLAAARAILMPLMDDEEVPLAAYTQLLAIATGENWPEERVRPFVDQLLKRSPSYYPAHFARAYMLLPRWGGNPHDAEAYAKRVADQVGGEDGDILYAKLAGGLSSVHSAKSFFEVTGFDSKRVQRGFETLAKRSPVAVDAVQMGLRLAAWRQNQQDAAVFEKVLQDLQADWDSELWKQRSEYERVRTWARQG